MVKFFRLFGNQYFGFWALGLALFVIQEIPYMVMPFFKLETNPIMNMKESSVILEIFEKILGSACVAFMFLIIHKESGFFSVADGREKLFFILSVFVLLLNFIGWAIYFCGHQSVLVMMFFIVLMPPLYYVFIGLWRSNILLTVTGGIFLVVHFIHVFGNLRMQE